MAAVWRPLCTLPPPVAVALSGGGAIPFFALLSPQELQHLSSDTVSAADRSSTRVDIDGVGGLAVRADFVFLAH